MPSSLHISSILEANPGQPMACLVSQGFLDQEPEEQGQQILVLHHISDPSLYWVFKGKEENPREAITNVSVWLFPNCLEPPLPPLVLLDTCKELFLTLFYKNYSSSSFFWIFVILPHFLQKMSKPKKKKYLNIFWLENCQNSRRWVPKKKRNQVTRPQPPSPHHSWKISNINRKMGREGDIIQTDGHPDLKK